MDSESHCTSEVSFTQYSPATSAELLSCANATAGTSPSPVSHTCTVRPGDGVVLPPLFLPLQALFASEHLLPIHCEPTQYPCSPFLQISSYSFVIGKEEERLQHLMERLKGHLREMPQSLIVFEDFDRFDCALRDFVRDVRLPASPSLQMLNRCVS